MPRGHTIVHFPHNIQPDIISATFPARPLCRSSRIFLTLILLSDDAVQVALHEPHAIQRSASGSIRHNSSNNLLSALSRSMAALGESLNPNPFIFKILLSEDVLRGLLREPLQVFREPFWGLCRLRHRTHPSWARNLCVLCYLRFSGNCRSRQQARS